MKTIWKDCMSFYGAQLYSCQTLVRAGRCYALIGWFTLSKRSIDTVLLQANLKKSEQFGINKSYQHTIVHQLHTSFLLGWACWLLFPLKVTLSLSTAKPTYAKCQIFSFTYSLEIKKFTGVLCVSVWQWARYTVQSSRYPPVTLWMCIYGACVLLLLTRCSSPVIWRSSHRLISDVAHIYQMLHHSVKITCKIQQQLRPIPVLRFRV